MSSLGPPAGPPTPEQLAALAKGQKEGQAVILWTVGMFCIFGWDYFMNLPKEIERIWRKKFTYVSALYIANRYYGLLQFAVVIPLFTTPLTGLISVELCSKIFRWQPVGALISTILSQVIMGSRVYALFGKSNIILGVLAIVMLVEFGIHAYVMTIVFPVPSPAPGVVVPCVAIGPTEWLVAFWVMPLIFDSLTFLLTLFKSVQHWRNRVESSTLNLLFRDGLIYFAAIFAMNLVNVILFVTQSPTLQAINLPATLMLNIIMSCKLVLNLRGPHSPAKPSSNRSDPSKMERKVALWQQPETQKGTYELSSMSTPSQGATVVVTSHTETTKSYV